MIGRLRGRVVAQEEDGTIVLDVSGVGYEVTTPLGTIGRLSAGDGGEVEVFVHTHVREDTFSLFAFASAGDRAAFRALIAVSNVGPRTAIAILSALPAAELARAIAQKELGKLTTISGIGKKTAERLLLELRDKLPMGGTSTGAPVALAAAAAAKSVGSEKGDLLLGALTRLGYKPVEAERAVRALGARVDEAAMPELVREALLLLAK